MKRVCIAIATLLVACQGLAEAPSEEASTVAPEVKTKVMIEIGDHSFGYRKLDDEGEATTEKTRLPEVPIGEKFKVKVKWTGGQSGDKLILSNFSFYALNTQLLGSSKQLDAPLWRKLEGQEIPKVLVEGQDAGGVVPFEYKDRGEDSEAVMEFEETDLTERVVDSATSGEVGSGALLIFFDVELKGQQERVFLFDPPWAGKRGGG